MFFVLVVLRCLFSVLRRVRPPGTRAVHGAGGSHQSRDQRREQEFSMFHKYTFSVHGPKITKKPVRAISSVPLFPQRTVSAFQPRHLARGYSFSG